LASILELTPRKRKLYERIQNKESALCKLKKKYKTKKLEKLYCVDSDARLLAAAVWNNRQKPKGRRWKFEDIA
jgi:23S rRNA G2445 N2-methylase RlmL